MIYLLTGQPGNGKTSLMINKIKAYLAEGRVVYTVGIPELNLPVIQLSREQIKLWHERDEVTAKQKAVIVNHRYTETATQAFKDAAGKDKAEEPITVLKNIAEGAAIFVDEAQIGFEPTGTNVPEYISYLSLHRHHGLDFIFGSQYPFLVHKTIQALVTTHWHIRYTWKGRKIHEWPEWQASPQTQTAINLSVTKPYEIDKTTFQHYQSASIHTKVNHKTPWQYYAFICAFLAVPVLAYASYQRVISHTKWGDHEQVQSQEKPKSQTNSVQPENDISKPDKTPEPVSQSLQAQAVYEDVQLVSNKYDWTKIAACVRSGTKCKCYGDSGNTLVVPDSVCSSAVDNGWGGRPNTPVLNPQSQSTSVGVSGRSPDGGQRPLNGSDKPLREHPQDA